MTAKIDSDLTQRAKALSRLYTLCAKRGGSPRMDRSGNIIFVKPGAPDKQIGKSVEEALAFLVAEEQRASA